MGIPDFGRWHVTVFIQSCTRVCEKLCCESGFCARIGAYYYDEMVEREVSLGMIRHRERVLCVGGGRTPFTACLFAEKTGADVTVIDHDPTVIADAEAFISSWKLPRGEVRCKWDDGQNPGHDPYDIAHIALQVTPQARVTEAMFQLAGCKKVLCRIPKPGVQNQYPEALGEADCKGCAGRVAHSGARMAAETVLFTKEAFEKEMAVR